VGAQGPKKKIVTGKLHVPYFSVPLGHIKMDKAGTSVVNMEWLEQLFNGSLIVILCCIVLILVHLVMGSNKGLKIYQITNNF
jgi:hypothetical protein